MELGRGVFTRTDPFKVFLELSHSKRVGNLDTLAKSVRNTARFTGAKGQESVHFSRDMRHEARPPSSPIMVLRFRTQEP